MAFNFHNWDEEPTLQGVLAGKYRGIGKFNRDVWVLKCGDKTIHSWSYVQLFTQLVSIPFKTEVKITYNGKKEMPDIKNRFYRDFTVEIIAPPPDSKPIDKK